MQEVPDRSHLKHNIFECEEMLPVGERPVYILRKTLDFEEFCYSLLQVVLDT